MEDPKRTEELSITLKNSGLASSMNEALRMAKEMLGTGDKVQEDFEKRSEFITKKVDEMKKERLGIKKPKKSELDMYEENRKVMIEKAKKEEPLVINIEYETPNKIKKEVAEDETALKNIMEEDAEKIYDKKESKEQDFSIKEIKTEPIQKTIEPTIESDVDLTEMFDFTKRPCE